MTTDIQIYCNCMAEVRNRIGVVQGLFTGQITTHNDVHNTELIFLQLRKTLELIAFASLSANKEAYSTAYATFATQWRAKTLLETLEKINPEYYPVPLDPPQETAPGVKHFPRPDDGFMTPEEFVSLYDSCSKVLHTRNPFNPEDPTIHIGYSVQQWVSRIQRLLGWHLVHLVGGDNKWIVHIPPEGDAQAWPASPRD